MMNRSTSKSHHGRTRSPRTEIRAQAPRSRVEEERQRRRREWIRQQEMEREHEKLKKKRIMEYEMKRARELQLAKQRSPHHSRSKTRSRSAEVQHRRTSPKVQGLSEKAAASAGNASMFKGPDGLKISLTELHRINVVIHRKMQASTTSTELHREIINPEDVNVKRREGNLLCCFA